METSITKLFEFFATQQLFTIDNHILEWPAFSVLRRSIRRIILALDESDLDEASELSGVLRATLSEWLTVPVAFDHATFAKLKTLGTPVELGRRWGSEVRSWYEDALGALQALTEVENPLRARVRDTIRACHNEGKALRIYCHRRAIPHYVSLLDQAGEQSLSPQDFISSIATYRSTGIFHTMIKVGPLRSRGWGAVPDALITAPRFSHLSKFVWAGCLDDKDFGYDPVGALRPQQVDIQRRQSVEGPIAWHRSEDPRTVPAVGSTDESVDIDDLVEISRRGPPQEYRRAVLVQIDEHHGILYPPLSRILSYDPQEKDQYAIAERLPGDSLNVGMYLILPIIEDEEVSSHVAEDGYYSRLWKALLRAEMARDVDSLVKRLKQAGIDLLRLRSRLDHWCKAVNTVIPAPQQREHFRILTEVLDFESRASSSSNPLRSGKSWLYAWNEIARSRGEAIQTGMSEHEAVDQELERILRERSTLMLVRGCTHLHSFVVKLEAHSALVGEVRFHKVQLTESGYSVPEGQLKQIIELDVVDQWRA
jgi:hypothetical protein